MGEATAPDAVRTGSRGGTATRAQRGPEGPPESRPPHADCIVPGRWTAPDGDAERADGWGFQDTEFRINPAGHVELTGGRYELCGAELPELRPWLEARTQLRLDPADMDPSSYPPPVPAALDHPHFLDAVAKFLAPDAIARDAATRLRHGHGHTQEEIFAVRHGGLDRIPDVVLFPGSEAEVELLVETARTHDVCLIPYGGGTNVTEALRCPRSERRVIASVDMRRMNRILWIDPVNQMARIEAGAVGRQIHAQLAEYGFTLGHEPDSVEHSTLGGWIATHASGMKKNRYGNIEDLLLDVHVVTARGVLRRPGVFPRESSGLDVRRWVLGSEGCLGIITSATLRIFPAPPVQEHGSILFHDFDRGIAFLRELERSGPLPASVRLMDNTQFQFGQVLRPRREGLAALRARAERLYVTRLRGFDPDRMTACTLVFEGTRAEVREQQRRVAAIARRHCGLRAGAENGRRGYQLTFGIAYIRDFVMRHHVLAESFETSVAWSDVAALCRNVPRRVREEHTRRQLPGVPFVCARITQLYPSGVCVYFYLGVGMKDVPRPSAVYAEIERAARDEILRSGGSLSHHHGVGKLRQHFLPRVLSPGEIEWIGRAKQALDPHNVFGAGNQVTWRSEDEDAGDAS